MYDVISKRIQTFSPRHKQFVNIYTPITTITILLFLRLFRALKRIPGKIFSPLVWLHPNRFEISDASLSNDHGEN